MPYSGASDKDLPDYVKKMSLKKKEQWVKVWMSTYNESHDEAKAFKYANGVVKRSKKSYDDSGEWVPDRKLFPYELNYQPYGAHDGMGCANCWFRQTASYCYLLYGDIAATGICDMYKVPPGFEEPDEEGVLQQIKSLLESLNE